MDVLEELDDLDMQHQVQPERQPPINRIRIDPFNTISNPNVFKKRYRFSIENARTITEMVRPIFNINRNRGAPCTPEQIVCSGLEILSGGQFFRSNGDASGICSSTAWKNLYRFVDAVLDPTIRSRFLHLPTQQQQLQNMQECYAKYKLPNIIGGIDGCHIPFLEQPRRIPGGRDHVSFINRKGMYSINAQIVGGIDRRIYDIQLSSPGSYHDSATYTMSMFKGWLETRNELGG